MTAKRRKSLIAPVLFGAIGTIILIVLGTWQMQRLEWKEALIAEIEAQMASDPVPIPETTSPEDHELLHVAVQGRLGEPELHIISSIKTIGPGFRVVVPMETSTGRMILVDLGFIPERMKEPAARTTESVRFMEGGDPHEVTGFLRWPNEADSMTPEADMAKNIWFAREVDKMAETLGTEPILIVAETHPDAPWPRPQPPGVGLPNRHLEYALTWFGLAIVWMVMTVVWVRSLRRAS